MLAGLECFKQGYIWRAGNGSQINIWNMKVLTPRGNILVSTVDEIISPLDGHWDLQIICSLFWPTDVHRILQIPIRNGREDVVAWLHNWNGLFTVKSAYHCQWNQRYCARNNADAAGGTSSSSVWKGLWKLSGPSKIKTFAWRVLDACIPCLVILANKHI